MTTDSPSPDPYGEITLEVELDAEATSEPLVVDVPEDPLDRVPMRELVKAILRRVPRRLARRWHRTN